MSFQLRVILPNKAVKVGELVFFDPYYDLALLEISADMPLQGPSFVSSSPNYGEEVFVLARDGSSALMVRKGSVLWHEEPYEDRNFYLYLSCEPPEVLTSLLCLHGVFLPNCFLNPFVYVRCSVAKVDW